MLRALFLVIIAVTGIQTTSMAQLNLSHISYKAVTAEPAHSPTVRTWYVPGFSADKPRAIKQRSPTFSMPVNTAALLGENYWMGSVTQQSYNAGKIGRYYYWDVQGNLRGSHLFLDIAGKNKRGLKLVFPRHRALF